MKLAFIGQPGAGKSTLMAACSGRKMQPGGRGREEAGQAVLPVPDARVNKLSAMFNPKKTTYAQVIFVDPAMPVTKADDPASRLPAELRQADGLILVAGNFTDSLLAPVQEQINAMEQELILNDLITVERRLERIAADKQRGRGQDNEELALLEAAHKLLEQEKPLRVDSVYASHPKLKGFAFLSARPLLVVVNNDDDQPEAKPVTLPQGATAPAIVVRASLEAELAELDEGDRAEFMADYGLLHSALDMLINAAYQALNVVSFFTVGEDEVRAWTIQRDSPADVAAGAIHSDLQKGFIRAEVMTYSDLVELGSEAAVKKAGRFKLAGKDYAVQDGDIMHVRFNV